jgi:APA family basic amino acid/polyamine antiporter
MTDEAARPFGFWTATALVVGGVIGAGIYILPSQFGTLGWTGVVAWILAGAGSLIIGRVIASLTAARPTEPGLIAIIGEVLGPVAGVLVGWGAWVSYWCANAYIALTAARYAGDLFPPLAATAVHQALTACIVIAGLTALNLTGLKSSGRFQVLTTILKLLPLAAVLVILVILTGKGGADFAREAHAPFDGSLLLAATSMTMVAIIGFETASIASERIRNPARNVPLATMLGIALSCLIYLVVCTGISFTIPAAQLAASTAPIAEFISHFAGPWAGGAVAGFAVISSVGCLNVWIMMQSEVPLGLVRAGLLPEWLGRTNSRDIAVAPTILASSLTCLLLILGCMHSGEAIMDFMLRLTAVTGVALYAFAAAAALRVRIRPVLSLLALIFSLAMMAGGGLEAVVLGLILQVAVLPLYHLAVRDMRQQPA